MGLNGPYPNPTSAETHVCGKRLAVRLALKRLAGATPEVNFRECTSHIRLCQVQIWLPTLALKHRETSPEVQNRGFSSPTNGHVSTNKFKKKEVFSTSSYFCRIIRHENNNGLKRTMSTICSFGVYLFIRPNSVVLQM